jgi:hypothetical protein
MHTATKQKTKRRATKERAAAASRALELVHELAQRLEAVESGLAALRSDVARLTAGEEVSS